MDIKIPSRKRQASTETSPGTRKHRRKLTYDMDMKMIRPQNNPREYRDTRRTDQGSSRHHRKRPIPPKHQSRLTTSPTNSSGTHDRKKRSPHRHSRHRSPTRQKLSNTHPTVSSTVTIPSLTFKKPPNQIPNPTLKPTTPPKVSPAHGQIFPKSPICLPTPNIHQDWKKSDPKQEMPDLIDESTVPDLTITVDNPQPFGATPLTPNQPTPSISTSSPLIEVPELMTDFDRDTYLNHKMLSNTFFHMLRITKHLNKTVHDRFARILKEEGFIKDN